MPQVSINPRQLSPPKTPDEFQYHSQNPPIQIPRNTHLDRLYNVKSPDPSTDNPFPMLRKPAVPTYQNDLILPSNGKLKQPTSPAVVTTREKIDGSTKLSLEDVRTLESRATMHFSSFRC
jgi:hypothetical protein